MTTRPRAAWLRSMRLALVDLFRVGDRLHVLLSCSTSRSTASSWSMRSSSSRLSGTTPGLTCSTSGAGPGSPAQPDRHPRVFLAPTLLSRAGGVRRRGPAVSIRRKVRATPAAGWLGLIFGLLLLTRQQAVLLLGGAALVVGLMFCREAGARSRLAWAGLLAMAIGLVLGGWFYLHFYRAYGSPVAFNRPAPPFSFANQPASFYLGVAVPRCSEIPCGRPSDANSGPSSMRKPGVITNATSLFTADTRMEFSPRVICWRRRSRAAHQHGWTRTATASMATWVGSTLSHSSRRRCSSSGLLLV